MRRPDQKPLTEGEACDTRSGIHTFARDLIPCIQDGDVPAEEAPCSAVSRHRAPGVRVKPRRVPQIVQRGA
jgi:hypothetical protein